MVHKFTTILAILALSASSSFAQTSHKCAAADLQKAKFDANPSLVTQQNELEAKTKQFIKDRSLSKRTGTILTIPVVFHIIHNGEAIGTGNNVSDAQIMLQLNRMNEDFRKKNADTLVASHAFYAVQADCEIEFCLAQRDAMGNATTGITRHNKSKTSWTIQETDSLAKPSTIWDRNKYMNIWCINLDDPASPGVDGYATFPIGSDDTTDGLVVATAAFGTATGGGKSIVASHEIGHYLNLLHIWGDATCGDDSVSDTPPAEESNSGCPTFPHNVSGPCTPGADGEMFMNFMDYSDAECTVMFTTGQKMRMQATLTAARASLITSDGCTPPLSIRNTIDGADNFNIYPNPNNGIFSIDANLANNEKVNIRLYNQMGVKVQQYDNIASFPYKVNLNEMPNGIYFIQLTAENNTQTKKIFITK